MFSLLSDQVPLPRRRRLLLLTILAQVLFIVAVAAAGYATTAYGRTIRLLTTPIDPRDLLYGDYVTLNYTISQLPTNLWREPGSYPRRGEPVYVVLRPAGQTYEAVRVYAKKPDVPADQVVLRGWVADRWRRNLRIRYNLERYYVPEGTGKELERRGARKPLLVDISIAPWGQARITGVEIIASDSTAAPRR
jgi:uncharacterized membrane-anchored protein